MKSVERLEKIMALLLAHSEKGLTVRELANACSVSLGTMQQDLKALLYSSSGFPIYTDHDESSEDSDQALLQPDVRWFLLDREGENPLIHLNIEEGLALLGALSFVKDSPEKKRLHEKILANFPLAQESTSRYIKGNMVPLHPIDPERFSLIESAILQEKKLAIRYTGKEKRIELEPLGLVYYSRLRCWYLVACQEHQIKTYHLSKVQEVERLNDPFQYPKEFTLKTWFEPRWGMEYGETYEVKVRFQNRSQTFSKLKKDVAHRTCRLTEDEEGSLLYEDRIIGKHEFIAWVLGFGSAAEILEPPELREEIRKRIQEALERYRK